MATTENGIYYPNDGKKAADVLADLKAMAESIDKNIQKNKFDDKDVKKDISDIKKEQETQNSDIENLQTNDTKQDELISKLKNAALNAETEEAKSIHVTDASTIGQLEVLGNHEQKTREGYNKYDYLKNLVDSIAGLTVTKDDEGYVIVNGTPEYNYAVLSTLVDITDNLEDGQTYTMWAENHYGNNDAGIYLQVRITKISDGTVQYLTTGNINRTFTVDKSLYTYKANIQTGTIALSGTFNNAKNRFMIYKGTDEKEFELYGASPSPEYPSEVKCLGSNKNIFDIENITENKYLNGYIQQTDYGNVFDSTTSNTTDYMKIYKNKTYAFSFDFETLLSTNSRGYIFYNEDKEIIKYNYDTIYNITSKILIITAQQNGYIRITYDKNCTNIKFEEGTEATPYSPPGQGSTKIKKDNGLHNIQVEQGSLNSSTGTIINADTRLRTADFVEIKNFNKIDCKGMTTCNVFFYDTNKTYLGRASASWETLPFQFEILQNAVYLKAIFRKDDEVVTPDMIKNLRLYSEETDYLLYIQQEMLKGDCFIKESDGWKEVNTWKKVVFNGTEAIEKNEYGTNSYKIPIEGDYIRTEPNLTLKCTHFVAILYNDRTINVKNIAYLEYITNHLTVRNTEYETLERFKTFLEEQYSAGNPVYVFYKTTTPTKLACTPEQSAVLEELNNMDLFERVNNIITAEDIALLKLKYALDVETYIDNKLNTINQQILEIAGGN